MTDKISNEEKVLKIQENFVSIMETLGLDLKDPSLKDTPQRIAKMYVNEIFKGITQEPPKLTVFDNTEGIDQIVIVRDITMQSMCEHHFMPFIGTVSIGYIPKGKIIGLSKMNRVTQHVAAKPQVQERLIQEIYDALQPVLGDDIIIVAKAKHFCSCMRGPKDNNSDTITSLAMGEFRLDFSLKQEFFNLLDR